MADKLPLTEALAFRLFTVLRLEGFFPEFKSEHAAKMFPRSALFSFVPGERVIDQGEEGRDMFIVHAGKVSITQTFGSAGVQLTDLKEGDIFGEMALIQDGVRKATVIVAEESQIFRLAYEDVKYILAHNPALGAHLKALADHRATS